MKISVQSPQNTGWDMGRKLTHRSDTTIPRSKVSQTEWLQGKYLIFVDTGRVGRVFLMSGKADFRQLTREPRGRKCELRTERCPFFIWNILPEKFWGYTGKQNRLLNLAWLPWGHSDSVVNHRSFLIVLVPVVMILLIRTEVCTWDYMEEPEFCRQSGEA